MMRDFFIAGSANKFDQSPCDCSKARDKRARRPAVLERLEFGHRKPIGANTSLDISDVDLRDKLLLTFHERISFERKPEYVMLIRCLSHCVGALVQINLLLSISSIDCLETAKLPR